MNSTAFKAHSTASASCLSKCAFAIWIIGRVAYSLLLIHFKLCYNKRFIEEVRERAKNFFYTTWGGIRGSGQPPESLYIQTLKIRPERNHNKQAKALLKVKESELIIESQAIGTSIIPVHKFKTNFISITRNL